MDIKGFWEKLTDDWTIKLLCLVAAILIYILYQNSLFETKTFSKRFAVVEDVVMCLASDVDSAVSISVRVAKKDLSAFSDDCISVYLDLTRYTEAGEHDVPLSIAIDRAQLAVDSVEVREVRPRHIPVTLEKNTVSWVPVEPLFSGLPAHGYERKSYSVSPDGVQISGPESMVKAISSMQTTQVDVKDAAATLTRDVTLLNKNKLIQVDYSGAVSVTANIVPVIATQVFKGRRLEFRSLSSDFVVTSVVPQVDIGFRGALTSLEGVQDGQSLAVVDCGVISEAGTYDLPVRILTPSGLSLVSQSLERVSVTVSESYTFRQRQGDASRGEGL